MPVLCPVPMLSGILARAPTPLARPAIEGGAPLLVGSRRKGHFVRCLICWATEGDMIYVRIPTDTELQRSRGWPAKTWGGWRNERRWFSSRRRSASTSTPDLISLGTQKPKPTPPQEGQP
jgi:hypothetical protein